MFLQRVEDILEFKIQSIQNKKVRLMELGVESVKMVEVAGLIEETYDVPINEDRMLALTVQDIVDFSTRKT